MEGHSREVTTALVRPAVVIGCAVIGCAFVDCSYVIWPIITGALALGSIAGVAYLRSRFFQPDAESLPHYEQHLHSEESAKCVQDLFSPYTPCAEQAAERLGRMRDAGAVPSLISVLDRSAWRDEPGWEPVCEAIVSALANIGDGRALPVLNRVRGSRGVRFRVLVDGAIASITDVRSHNFGQHGLSPQPAPSWSARGIAAVPERTAGRRAALIPLGDEEAFKDSVAL